MSNIQIESAGDTNNLPDFIIIGAQKAGTTALVDNLRKHPDIFTEGEINFFASDAAWEKGITWYSDHFSEADKIQGEKTPEYMISEKAIQRIAQTIPNVKLIIMLRNPVSRAYSAWNHFNQILEQSKSWGWRIESFETAVFLAKKKKPAFLDLISRGNYIYQINQLIQYFPREQMFFGIAERFLADPNGQMNNVLDFLGAERMDIQPQLRHTREYREQMKPEIKRYLEKLFESSNQQLFDFLGEEIKEW